MTTFEHCAAEYKVKKIQIDVYEDIVSKKHFICLNDIKNNTRSEFIELDSDGMINIGKLL
jgi:hypothetical protein